MTKPVLVAMLCVIPCAPFTRLAAGETCADDDAAIAVARRSMQALCQRSRTPGLAMGVAIDGEVVWAEAFGKADLEADVAATAATRFGIGSISKSLTMALVGRLVDQGKLDLDDPIETYLPPFHHRGKGITIRHIAAHLSGLDDSFATARWSSDEHFETTAAALRHIEKEPLLHAPGEKHFYATGTYTIIAAVVEAVTGSDFLTVMQEEVLAPLKMTATVPNDPRRSIRDVTRFYLQDDEGNPKPAETFDPSFKWAGAGYLSTVEDLLRFAEAMLGDAFLSEEVRDELMRSHVTTTGEDTGFGLGWRIGEDEQLGRLIHQPGGGPGISCWLFVMPDRDMATVVLSNMTGAPVGAAEFDTAVRAFANARAAGASSS